MGRPVIALLTDFGTANHYAGAMKGVMLGICPDVTLVDIAHDVPRRVTAASPPAPYSSSSSTPAWDRRAAAWPPKAASTASWRRTTAC
jgi:hypothetical protein